MRLPSGIVTLLFTDIEGSTRLLQRTGSVYADLLASHRRLLRSAFKAHGGVEVSTTGDGFLVAFSSADDAVAAARDGQRALVDHEWSPDEEVRVRMGLHTGEPQLLERSYAGLDVHRAARVMSAGHGGQVLVSQATHSRLTTAVDLVDLGEHRLKDLLEPERLYQLRIEGLPGDFPALMTIGNRPTNLPVLPTALIGREAELATIQELLTTGGVRLLTLTGPGGTGKTRLALQVAAELVDHFADGVFFVPLSAIRDPALIVPTIAKVLGVREAPGESLAETLSRHLQPKHLLLVVDNVEHVVAGVTPLSPVLATAASLSILATSRERLQLAGERVYEVPPLPLPKEDDVEMLAQTAATALFVTRATALKPDFSLTTKNAAAVRDICAALDGLPLAIELAAARVSVLPPDALLKRLDERLKLLTGGARDAEERQRTLRSTIEWSYDLLTEDEQRLFARLSIFPGGCTLEAAEEICDADIDLLASLIEKSLIRNAPPVDASEPRFVMLRTVREYAQGRLREHGVVDDVMGRHADYYLDLVETAAGRLQGSEQGIWFDRLAAEHDNLRTALSWLLERGDRDRALRLAGPLWTFWESRGYLSEGAAALAAALGDDPPPTLAAAHALRGAGCLADSRACYDEADDFHGRAAALYEALGDRPGLAWTLNNHALVYTDKGDLDRAVQLHEQSLAIAREIGDRRLIASVLINLSNVAWYREDFDRAESLQDEGRRLTRELGDTSREGIACLNLGWIHVRQGDAARATPRLLEAMAIFRALHQLRLVPDALEGLAAVASMRDDPWRSAILFGAGEGIRVAIGAPMAAAEAVIYEPYFRQGRAQLGDDRYERALADGRAMTVDEAVEYARRDVAVPAN